VSVFDWFRRDALRTLQITELRLGPGDIVVLRTAQALSAHEADRLQSELERAIGTDNRCIVLERGIDIDVIRAQRDVDEQQWKIEAFKNGKPCEGTVIFNIGDNISVRFVAHRPMPRPPLPPQDDVPFKRA
jgi:hypothetical protein